MEAGPQPDAEVKCGNGLADENEVCDPASSDPTRNCVCNDNDTCTIDHCATGTGASDCSCICEFDHQESVFGVGTCNDGNPLTNDIVLCNNPNDPNDMSCAATCQIFDCSNEILPHCGNGMLDVADGETCDDSSTNVADHCPATDDNNMCTDNVCTGDALGCNLVCNFPLKTGFPYDTCDDGRPCTADTGTADNVACTSTCGNMLISMYEAMYCDAFDTVCRDFYSSSYDPVSCVVGCMSTPVAAWYTMANTFCANAALPCADNGMATGHDLNSCTFGCNGYTADNAWLTAYCRAQEPRLCRTNSVQSYNLNNPGDEATNLLTCDTMCTASVFDGDWLVAQQNTCATTVLACLDQAPMPFNYNSTNPMNPATCDGTCNYVTDAAWLAMACNDGNVCTTESPAYLQTGNVIATGGACTENTAYTCNRVDTTMNADPIDGSSMDTNCDGIDGLRSEAVLVSAAQGIAGPNCGLTDMGQLPCSTVQAGVSQAATTGRPYVYVQTATYTGALTLPTAASLNITILGGWGVPVPSNSINWTRGVYTSPGFQTTILGALESVTGRYMAVRAVLGSDTVIRFQNLSIQGPNAPAVAGAGASGVSTYAVHASGFGNATARLEFNTVTITAGNGSSGIGGSNGANATTLAATDGTGGTPNMRGQDGGGGGQNGDCCDTSSRGGSGPAGVNSCSGGGVNPNGGAGGVGGAQDTNCSGAFGCCGNCNPTGGTTGNNASSVSGINGTGGGGSAGSGSGSGMGGTGNNGYRSNGAAGTTAVSGQVSSGFWFGRAGGNGAVGDHGGGGGGGGGSGGCNNDNDDWGAGGGGGGAGGCRALSGGGGGGAGGGSFGVFLVGARADFGTAVSIVRGNGGDGGNGGTGGQGQVGGVQGGGGSSHDCAGPGGPGGAGNHGGHGGGGAGGVGGHSVGVFSASSSTVNGSPTYTPGTAGTAGGGGQSAPGAPAAIDDGNDGVGGTNGSSSGLYTCANLTSC